MKHRSAEYYARNFKWHVFPVKNRDKTPLTRNGVKDATLNQEQINKWWNKLPDSNIGISTGRSSGFIVIDIDEGGEDSLRILTEQYEPLPETVEAITGSGGRHILLKYPCSFKGTIRNKVNFIPNVDIRGDGGYIVSPPSLHKSGQTYEWEVSSRPEEIEISTIPDWLLKLLVEPKGEQINKKSSIYWTSLINGVNEGGRNQATASLTGYLFRKYVDPILVFKIIQLWNTERNNPPLDDAELIKTIDSIAGKELARRTARE